MATFSVVQNQFLATSGEYMQAFIPDLANHHIINPRVGYSYPELSNFSIVASIVTLADRLATR